MTFKFFNHDVDDIVNCDYKGKKYILTIKKRTLTLFSRRYSGEGVPQHKIRVGPGPGISTVREDTELRYGSRTFPVILIPDMAFKKRIDDSVEMENKYLEEKVKLEGIKETQISAINKKINYMRDFFGRSI